MNPEQLQQQIDILRKQLATLQQLFNQHHHVGVEIDQTPELDIPDETTPGGSTTELQFNDGGVFAGTEFDGVTSIAFDKTTGKLTFYGDGLAFQFVGRDAPASSGANGTDLVLTGGRGDGAAEGGNVSINGGQGGTTGEGGDIELFPGAKGSGATYDGNVICGGQNIATTARGQFLVIPYCAGPPTGTPVRGMCLIYDSTNNDLYVYNGGWKKVHLA